MISGVTLNPDAPRSDPEVMDEVLKVALRISGTANRNITRTGRGRRPRIGITARIVDAGDGPVARIGPRGVPAIAVEYGTAYAPAQRPVKRALDQHRIR